MKSELCDIIKMLNEWEKSLSERDIITKYILVATEQSGWNKQIQIREEVTFTAGRIFVKGRKTKRGKKKRADIIIYGRASRKRECNYHDSSEGS